MDLLGNGIQCQTEGEQLRTTTITYISLLKDKKKVHFYSVLFLFVKNN